jgi:histidine triad (HIT) family protein
MSSTKGSINVIDWKSIIKIIPYQQTAERYDTMTQNCIFCRIIRKEAPATVVYEDAQVLAFLSNRPVNEGHTLVVPKTHYENIYEIPEDEAAYLFRVTKRLAHAVRDAGAEGIRIVQNNGSVAGQVVFHLHIHIIPMKSWNQLHDSGIYRDPAYVRSAEELEKDAQAIRQHLKSR